MKGISNLYNTVFYLIFSLIGFSITAQTVQTKGRILNVDTKIPIHNAIITNGIRTTQSDLNGFFTLVISVNDLLTITALGYEEYNLSVQDGKLGTIYLKPNAQEEFTTNLITLTENELANDETNIANASGLLQATRDVFLQRAAFDFGQAFFRVRGMDSRNGEVRLNGVLMNKIFDGRPQWNNWGGLNDVIRNQEFTLGLQPHPFGFGGIVGHTNIDLFPSGLRPGWRLTNSLSNRTYRNRLMVTYNSGATESDFQYLISASKRWGNSGFMDGTNYDATSLFGSLEWEVSPYHKLNVVGVWAHNIRGRSAPVTQEIFELGGRQYNPYWGSQNDEIRNSRTRNINEPLFLITHKMEKEKFMLQSSIAYQFGSHKRSRLSYFNAPNPDPTYYRYLPSFYINNPIGADFTNAALAREGFLNNPQINWTQLYQANKNLGEGAAYILGNDVHQSRQIAVAVNGSFSISNALNMDFGILSRRDRSAFYAEIDDLLGAENHFDTDPFSGTANNLLDTAPKEEGDLYNYHYLIRSKQDQFFTQIQFVKNQWKAFASTSLMSSSYQREGLFQNERFLSTSFGPGEALQFLNLGFKTGMTYAISARHFLSFEGTLQSRPPTVQNSYINPRENQKVVTNLLSEKLRSLNLNYNFTLPDLDGRITGFFTRQNNLTDINFFFVDAGVGSEFVQEVVSDLAYQYTGLEMGLNFQASAEVKLSAALNFGKYIYADDPTVQINFDTAGAEEELINLDGELDLGTAQMKGLRLPTGPQTAVSLGVYYNAPKYWWLGTTANYMTNAYVSPSAIIRTESFLFNPDTGNPFPEATPEKVNALRKQHKIPEVYLLNLVGGKSWKFDKHYLSLFLSLNNLFDETFVTGGFEQSRNGNFAQLQQDTLRDNPSFAPKFWYGFGRTYFINLALSF